jgi:predicted nucleic acid-binding protein
VIVVADAGPLIHLAAINRLELVAAVGDVLIPPGVYEEVVVIGAGLPGAQEVSEATWISVVTPTRLDLVNALLAGGLHRGESEAMALALERQADVLLMDERQGRLTAEAMGIRVIGTIGLVIAARQRGALLAVAPVLSELRTSGLWMSDELVRQVLATVGESEG